MNKIIFICRNYGDPKSACGICVKNLVDEFQLRNFEIWVISVTKEPIKELLDSKEIHYSYVKEGWFTTFNRQSKLRTGLLNSVLFKLVYLIRLPYVLLNFPILSKRLKTDLTSHLRDLIKNNGIYYVVGTNSPFEPIQATIDIKKEFGTGIKAVCYHLDPVLLQDNKSKAINLYKDKRSYVAVTEEANVVDLILAQQSTKGLISKPNIEYVDFPLFIKNDTIEESGVKFSSDYVNITYVGTLDEDNRNPQFFLDLLNDVYRKTKKQTLLHIWGFIRESATVERLKTCPFVIYHGMIEPTKIMDILLKSDFLLNISNLQSYNAVPSKIFQLFSTKKPIINVVRHPEDFAKQYFEKYPSVLVIEEYRHIAEPLNLVKYIEDNYGKSIELPDNIYETSTPEYISDLIIGE